MGYVGGKRAGRGRWHVRRWKRDGWVEKRNVEECESKDKGEGEDIKEVVVESKLVGRTYRS